MEPTPLEMAQFRASSVAAGISVTLDVQQMLERGEECKLGVQDRELPQHVRTEALAELRHINTQLAMLGELLAANGISA